MNILLVTSELPIMPEEPGAPRTAYLAEGLSRSHSISLLVVSGTPFSDRNVPDYHRRIFSAIRHILRPTKFSFWRKWLHRLNLGAALQLSYRDPDFIKSTQEQIRDIINKDSIDVCIANGYAVSELLPDDRPSVLDLCDCMSLYYSRLADRSNNWWASLTNKLESLAYRRWELQLAKKYSEVVLISAHDVEAFDSPHNTANLSIVGLGMDFDFFSSKNRQALTNEIALIGVMNYAPNEDAAIFFIDEVFPLIKKQVPDATFTAVGANPGKALLEKGSVPDVTVTGWVEDVRPYYEKARVIVCPLRFGAGIKNKVLAAIAMEVPTVITPVAAEGIPLEHGKDAYIGRTPGELAQLTIDVLSDYSAATNNAQSARSKFEDIYSWKSMVAELEKVVGKCPFHPLQSEVISG